MYPQAKDAKDCWQLLEAERPDRTFSPTALTEISPPDTLISDFQTPELWDSECLLLKAILLCSFVTAAQKMNTTTDQNGAAEFSYEKGKTDFCTCPHVP